VIATLANSAWLASCTPEYLRFRRALSRVRTEQERVLHGVLRKNQASAFGRRHGFSAICTVRDYQSRVPLSDYNDYRARVARIAEGETQVLTCERVRLFEPTSGSSPFNKSSRNFVPRSQGQTITAGIAANRTIALGQITTSASIMPATECTAIVPQGLAPAVVA